MSSYTASLDGLLNFDDKDFRTQWPDYIERFGLTFDHIPDLIRMAGDPGLFASRERDAWAPVHARRALGQLRAVVAVDPLIAAMEAYEDTDDFFLIDLPKVYGLIGPGAIPALASRLHEKRPPSVVRIMCAESLEQIATSHPEARDECVAILTEHLARKEDDGDDSWGLNGFVLSSLLSLKAVEAIAVIQEAFAADVVDESITGGLATSRFKLGLGPEPKGNDIAKPWRMVFPSELMALTQRRPDLSKLKKQQQAAKKKGRKQNRKP